MLHSLLYANWEEPPECMAFEAPFEEVLARIQDRLPRILAGKDKALAEPAAMSAGFWADCLDLYLLTPALVNIALNHKVCIEHGLPLHPTYYFQVSEADRFRVHHSEQMVLDSQAFFLEAIATAQALYGLAPDAPERLAGLVQAMPGIVSGFIYTSTKDRYTWRASDPRKISDLADAVRRKVNPVIIIGAAHGSIVSGLVLANLLRVPLYFIRFSMFKRNDTAPIITPSDHAVLGQHRDGPALIFDEDVAKGTTMTKFSEVLQPMFRESYTARVLRHALSPCWPDFFGRSWHD